MVAYHLECPCVPSVVRILQFENSWVRAFKYVPIIGHDERRSGQPSFITEDLVHKVDEILRILTLLSSIKDIKSC